MYVCSTHFSWSATINPRLSRHHNGLKSCNGRGGASVSLRCQTPSCIPHPSTTIQDFTRIYSTLGLGKGITLFSPSKNNCKLTRTLSIYLSIARSETVAALQAFRKRHSDAQRISGQLNAQPTTADLAHYRSVLKNKGIVDEVEKVLREFKPVTYDVSTHVKAIETFETKAVRFLPDFSSPLLRLAFAFFTWLTLLTVFAHRCVCPARPPSWIVKAKETEAQIDVELKDLQATLSNIQDARPFEDLTVRPLPSRT